ncbi:hypothetical protein ACFTZJ_21880 [Streptomyces globisporus]
MALQGIHFTVVLLDSGNEGSESAACLARGDVTGLHGGEEFEYSR